jgi:hypothetical protein
MEADERLPHGQHSRRRRRRVYVGGIFSILLSRRGVDRAWPRAGVRQVDGNLRVLDSSGDTGSSVVVRSRVRRRATGLLEQRGEVVVELAA